MINKYVTLKPSKSGYDLGMVAINLTDVSTVEMDSSATRALNEGTLSVNSLNSIDPQADVFTINMRSGATHTVVGSYDGFVDSLQKNKSVLFG